MSHASCPSAQRRENVHPKVRIGVREPCDQRAHRVGLVTPHRLRELRRVAPKHLRLRLPRVHRAIRQHVAPPTTAPGMPPTAPPIVAPVPAPMPRAMLLGALNGLCVSRSSCLARAMFSTSAEMPYASLAL